MSRKKKRNRDERELTISVDQGTTGSMMTTAPIAFAVPGGPVDLLDRPVDPLHRDLLELYLRTKAMCARSISMIAAMDIICTIWL